MDKLAAARKQLRDVLASLYKDSRSIQRIIDDAGMSDLGRIDMSGSSVDTWHEVLKEAEKHNKIESIIEVVKSEYSNYAHFISAAESYKTVSSSSRNTAVTNDRRNQIEHHLGVDVLSSSVPTMPLPSSQVEITSWRLMIFKWVIELSHSKTVQAVIILLLLAIVSLPVFLLDRRINEWLFYLKFTPSIQYDTPTPTIPATVTPTQTATPMPTSTPTSITGVTVNFSCAEVNELAPPECEALVALYNSTGGPKWITKTNWLVTNTPCNWHGISCTLIGNTTHVTMISLASNNLIGQTPRQLGDLTQLTVLALQNNQLTGTMLSIGNLINLEQLFLGNNQLTGGIPSQLYEMKLKVLQLSGNPELLDHIPQEITMLKTLEVLDLAGTGLRGVIRPELYQLENLYSLDLSGNQLSGEIPLVPDTPNRLRFLDLGQNQLSGKIPQTLNRLKNLECLDLSHNQLTRYIPVSFMDLKNLIGEKEDGELCPTSAKPGWLDLSYNTLNAIDPTLLEFLQQTDPDWAQTQRYDLVGHWQFDECVGNVVNDTSGLENHGNRQEAVTFTDDGVSECALQFPATGGLVTIAHSPALEPITGTIIAWVKVDRLPVLDVAILGKTTDFHINRKGGLGSGTVYDLRITTKGEVVGIVMNDDLGVESEWSFASSQPNSIAPAIWQQIAFRWDDNTLSIFIDGQTKPEWKKSYKPIPNVGLSYHGRSPLFLGAYSNNNLGNFDGQLDEVSFYARALSDEEIQRNYQLYAGSLVTPPTTICPSVSEISLTECEALVALYNSTHGTKWITKTNWLETNTPCSWYGIICNAGHVAQLSLPENGLNGVIPVELGNLSELTLLRLTNNKLAGSIPPELGNLTKLQFLGLHENQLSGEIPSQLGNLSNLVQLGLGDNRLVGAIPSQLGLLKNLEYLELYQNGLSGPIPSGLGNLSKLKELRLYNNFGLSGSIPIELGNLNALEKLHLSNNQLSGHIPLTLCQLPNLLQLDLNGNALVAADTELRDCLSAKDPNWETTQRILSPEKLQNLSPNIPAGQVWFNPINDAVHVYVPAGEFIMGITGAEMITATMACKQLWGDEQCGVWYPDDVTTQTVNLPAFWIMQTEVTNAQYKKCVDAHICANEETALWNNPNYTQHPVTNVTWQQASAYAGWVGSRLPSEAEWEKAARGTDGRIYPWGWEWDGSRLNFCDESCSDEFWQDSRDNDQYAETAPVGSYPTGASIYGALDMAGNVWEWTSSQHDEDRVIRGGSWNRNLLAARTDYHYYAGPNTASGAIGFRVVIVQPTNP